jgi:hypothetical protein
MSGWKDNDAVTITYRTLRQAQEEAAADERERIIKLLGVWDCNNDRCWCDSINECVYRQQLITLIKGKN